MDRRRAAFLLAGFVVAGIGFVAAANAWVLLAARGDSTTRVADVPRAHVAIVPGALVHPDGRMSAMLADRVHSAADLYRAGKVERILVSGDHHRLGYDEPDTMRDALLRAGIPSHTIFTDYAGFDTWSTMVRAREVFGVDHAVVVTQGFHMARALSLGRSAGLDLHGFVSDRGHSYGSQGTRSGVREVAARVKGLQQAVLEPAVLLGPSHPINGNGRNSWGPADPLAPRPPG
jgi:SanA protein